MHWESAFLAAPCRRHPVDRRGSRRMPMLLTAAAALIALAASSSQTRSQPADANPVVKAAEAACPPDAIALSPGMSIQAAINAVFYNEIQAIEDEEKRAARVEELRRELESIAGLATAAPAAAPGGAAHRLSVDSVRSSAEGA